MECFNNLLLKLREVHEREVEGWQVKIQELSNKKGCDTKRMEELFTKNQQMKEQQRLLTENIKTLENRLRAGLCDRCTVTQEVAKRRQQEFEASQIQSLQHISVLAAEMNNLKKDNKRLREELRSLRAAHDSATEVKHNGSPDLSPSSGPMALITTAPSRAGQQPAGGSVAMKTEADHRTEEADHRRGMNRSHFDSYKPISWKTEQSVARVGEMRRPQSVEGSIPRIPAGGEMNPSRHLLHAPVPCRPQPVKSSPVPLPWALTEPSDWVSAPGTGLVVRSSPKPNLSRFPNLIPTSQHANSRRQQVQQVFGSLWHKQSGPPPPAKEPTVVFRLRSQMPEHVENQTKPVEKREVLPTKTESVSGEGACDGPLDLSGPGKSKSSQSPRYDSPLSLQRSPDTANPSAFGPVSSTSPVVITSSSSTPTGQHEEESTSEQNHEVVKESEQKDEVNRKTDHNNGKKVPILTISLRPVVVLENLNSALQKEESLSSNGKSSSPAAEVGSSSEEQDEEGSVSGQESSAGSKRKRASVEIETDRDSETENIQPERKIKITVRAEAKSPC